MTPQKEFWNWFLQHETELFNLDCEKATEREMMFDQIASALQKVDKDLTFELSGGDEPIRDFVISAGGIMRAFPAVSNLVDAAPPLDRWRIIAFRPRRSPVHPIEFAGHRVDPEDVKFTLINNGIGVGIYLFIPNFKDNDPNLQQIGYLLLDESLGEYDVECRIGPLRMFSPETSVPGNRYPLAELPELFDKLILKLEKKV